MSKYNFIEYDFEPKVSISEYVFNANNVDFVSENHLRHTIEEKMARLPQSVIDIIEKTNWKIIITNKKEVDTDYTQNQLIQMYGTTNVEIYGNTNPYLQRAQVEATKKAIDIGLFHEIGHIIDFVLNNFSSCKEWHSIYELWKEKTTALPLYGQDEKEFFANCFAVYFEDREYFSRNSMKSVEDKIHNLIEILPYLDDNQFNKEPAKELDAKEQKQEDLLNPKNIYLDVDKIINGIDPVSYCY